MSDQEISSKLESLTFLGNVNRDRLKLLLCLTNAVLKSFPRLYRGDRRAAVSLITDLRRMYSHIQQIASATNAFMALRKCDMATWEYWAHSRFHRSPDIPELDWINSVWAVHMELLWPP